MRTRCNWLSLKLASTQGWSSATTVISGVALVVSGVEIVFSHPRFYLGESGNVNMKPLFVLPVASSRDTVPTAYKYVLPDQNGWSRYLHFEAAWLLLFVGALYIAHGFWTGRFQRVLLPLRGERGWRAVREEIVRHMPWRRGAVARAEARRGAGSYNALQRWTYALVVFVAFPLMVWTGLAMSPAFAAVAPWSVVMVGGRQTARTIHFLLTWALVAFLVGHVVMVATSGFVARMRGMVTGRVVEADAVEEAR